MSGTLRSSELVILRVSKRIETLTLSSAALDVFDEFEDAELYESLRRVALIPAHEEEDDGLNENVFRNLYVLPRVCANGAWLMGRVQRH